MKKNIYTFVILILLGSSCRSVEKMVDSGNYDQAIIFATEKLAGKKKKKTKYVQALEVAFEKITQRDMDLVNRLERSNDLANLDRIVSIYDKIDNRQERIRPFLPLTSKDGYSPTFKFVNVGPLLNKASESAAEFHYDQAAQFLSMAEGGSKDDAVRAYNALQAINKYFRTYKDSESLKRKAIDLGKKRILVKVENLSDAILPRGFEKEILTFDVAKLNSLWKTYYMNAPKDREIDYVSSLKINNLDISPEREIIRQFVEEKEIEDGWEYVLDSYGNVLKDTLGNDVKITRKVLIRADIVEIHREKFAAVGGRLEIWDARHKQLLESVPINVQAAFNDYASSYRGDKRAICDKTRRRLKTTPIPFPSDLDLIWESVEELKAEFHSNLRAKRI